MSGLPEITQPVVTELGLSYQLGDVGWGLWGKLHLPLPLPGKPRAESGACFQAGPLKASICWLRCPFSFEADLESSGNRLITFQAFGDEVAEDF